MPKLAILRGSALDREVELGDRDLRIGRDDQNEIVILDPTKELSRFHAELRNENGNYVLLDLQSQNGIWIRGQRQSKITLETGVAVTLGPYALVLEGPGAPTGETQAAGSAADKRNTIPVPSRMRIANPLNSPAAKAGIRAGQPAPGLIARLARLPRPALFGGFAVVLIAIMAVGQIFGPAEKSGARTVRRTVESRRTAGPSNDDLTRRYLSQARAQLARSDFDSASKDAEQVLAIEPDNPDAIELLAKMNEMKTLAQSMSASGPPTPPEGTAVGGNASDPSGAAQNGRAAGLPPPQPRTAGDDSKALVRVAPRVNGRAVAGSGLTKTPKDKPQEEPLPIVGRRPGETETDWLARGHIMADRYTRAKTALEAEAFDLAATELSDIQTDEPGYKDVPALLVRAREGRQAVAQQAIEVATRLEASGDWRGALQQYDRAQQLDPSMADRVEGPSKRIHDRMKTEGADAFTRARQYDAAGRNPEAIALYERASRYLPDDDANKKTAFDRLDVLRLRP